MTTDLIDELRVLAASSRTPTDVLLTRVLRHVEQDDSGHWHYVGGSATVYLPAELRAALGQITAKPRTALLLALNGDDGLSFRYLPGCGDARCINPQHMKRSATQAVPTNGKVAETAARAAQLLTETVELLRAAIT